MKVINHALIMIQKNIKSYILLSVTILLSFTIMLLYLIFTDSDTYNEYRDILGADDEIILSCNSYDEDTMKSANIISNQLNEMDNTYYYYMRETMAQNINGNQSVAVNVLPNYVWGIFEPGISENGQTAIVSRMTINNQYEFSIKTNEAIVSKPLYEYFSQNEETMEIKLVFTDTQGNEFLKKYNVIGYYERESYRNPEETAEGDEIYIANDNDINECNFINITMVVKTDNPTAVGEQMNKNGLSVINTFKEKENAIMAQNLAIQNKYIIAAVLFVLLGINLYSAFTNVLNDRKFEIGVKRAIGASKFSIMLQFVVEAMIVMTINILLAIANSVLISVLYKFFCVKIEEYVYVITISQESFILYFVFTVFLAVIFSLVFAYKSTNVEIIKYLKEES